MLLKDTPIGDIEVQSDDEKDARAFLDGLIARGQLALEGQSVKLRATHCIVVEDGVRKLQRMRF